MSGGQNSFGTPHRTQKSPIRAKKGKNDPKNQMSKLKEAKKTKVVAIYKQIPKQFEPDPNHQKSLFLHQKSQQMTPELDEIKTKN